MKSARGQRGGGSTGLIKSLYDLQEKFVWKEAIWVGKKKPVSKQEKQVKKKKKRSVNNE
jgi:hypothetical protein